jgi:hypothetical protein
MQMRNATIGFALQQQMPVQPFLMPSSTRATCSTLQLHGLSSVSGAVLQAASQHIAIVYHPPVLQGAFSCLCADDQSLVYGTDITDDIDDSCGDGHGTHELSGASSATSSKLVFCSINLD